MFINYIFFFFSVKEYVEEIGWGNLRSEKLSEISRLLQIDKGFKSKTSPNSSSTSTDESNDEKFVDEKSVSHNYTNAILNVYSCVKNLIFLNV
jgi:hypothetical protein